MGNSHSTRSSSNTSRHQSTEAPTASVPTPEEVRNGIVGVTQTPEKNEDDSAAPHVLGRRRSMLKFSSLRRRRRPRSVAGEEHNADLEAGLPSRRRWYGLSGIKSKPVSNLATSSSIIVDPQPGPSHVMNDPTPGDKGKEREEAPLVQTIEDADVAPDITDIAEEIAPPVAEGEGVPTNDKILQELRELTTATSVTESNSSSGPRDRPPTPIPSSVIGETDDLSNVGLASAIGSWLGSNRSQLQNTESQPAEVPVPPSPNSLSSDRQSRHGLHRTSQAASPTPPVPIVSAPAPNIGTSQSGPSERRHPTGAGTVVVVQGVVHTADVRQPQANPIPQSPPPSTTRARPTSSTSTIRNVNASPVSRADSRSSTPQPPHRSRFSSFANSFRQRSRPRASSSLRDIGANSLPQGLPGVSIHNEASEETASRLSLGSLGARLTSSDTDVSASMVTSSETSSVGAVVSTDDSSVWDSLPLDVARERQERRNQHVDRQTQDEIPSRETSAPTPNSSDNDADVSSDDDSDAELSANSIEVLGTLLSVATAATAASLVSGNTDPLFSSGLTGAPPTVRSSSSSPAGSSPIPGSSSRRPTVVTGNNDRARSMWENMRGRFSRSRGRRDAPNSNISEDREEAREQMFREMTRAFNLDFSGGGSSSRHEGANGSTMQNEAGASNEAPRSNDEAADTGAEAGGFTTPGPEGSFERFLHNLQVDLRTALVEDYAARRARVRATREQSQPAETSDTPQSPSPPPAPADGGDEQPTPTAIDGAEPWAPTPRTVHLDLPTLPGVGAQRTDGTDGPPQAQGITGLPGAGINWWRLYRFPPMTLGTSPAAGSTNLPSATGIPSTPEPPPPSSDNTEEPVSADPPSSDVPQQAAAPDAASNDPQQVVPVIVVGLQSVPVRARNENGEQGQPPHPDDNIFPGFDAPMDTPIRERASPFRAATRALNRLHRRTNGEATGEGSTPTPTNETPEPRARHGGRTYLIFVIGGYYPPNHSIVTGADDMNSFEALWDLAELIGQVKPPVATKEDIERSGLAVFKASAIPDYDKAGKIASNTVEKCVICLDEYEPEDDVRLLSCRHAFHKGCIDKWLETGRNNCPACRSQGVRTENDAPPVETSLETSS